MNNTLYTLPKVSSHKGKILYDLLNGEHKQNKKLFNEIDSCASAARISELRSDGWDINDKYLYQKSREGKDTRIKEYFIKRNNIFNYIQDGTVKEFIERCGKYYSKHD